MSKEVMYFITDCWYVEKAGNDINGNAKYKVYAYNHYTNGIIKGIVKEYLRSNLGNNNTDCKIGYTYDSNGDFKIVTVDKRY